MQNLSIVASNDTWPCSTLQTKTTQEFYSSIDFLLITSLLEGGPVPFMEALAMGKLSIAPSIGVIMRYSSSTRIGDRLGKRASRMNSD